MAPNTGIVSGRVTTILTFDEKIRSDIRKMDTHEPIHTEKVFVSHFLEWMNLDFVKFTRD